MNRNESSADTADREIVNTRVFDAPRALVFQAFTEPQHVAQCGAPRGFTTTIHQMDVRPGGEWRLVMHGPDGKDYHNRIIYREVTPPERLVFKHSPTAETEPGNHETTVTFEALGNQTRVTMRMVLASAATLEHIVKKYGAIEGAKQTFERLAEYLPEMAAGKSGAAAVPGEFMISRTFDAPRDVVFKAWTEREQLMRWWGPKGFEVLAAQVDLRPGGVFHYGLRAPNGDTMWGKWVLREVAPPERLVFVTSFSDEAGGLTRHPYSPTWPQQLLSTVTFADEGGRTKITVRWSPLEPTHVERKTFDEGQDSMRQGWGGTMDQFATYLATK